MFEWQRHSQDSSEVPHFQELLDFSDMRAQASEATVSDPSKKPGYVPKKRVVSHVGAADLTPVCVVCKSGKHPLYACTKFKSFSHDKMTSTLKANNLCINCLRPGHYLRDCKSSYRCKICRKPHHTLLHLEHSKDDSSKQGKEDSELPQPRNTLVQFPQPDVMPVSSTHAAMGIRSDVLLMTCLVVVASPDGATVKARALLDSASSASFISERLAQSLHLPRTTQSARISGVAGLSRNSPAQSIASFSVSAVYSPGEGIGVNAIVVPRVTCDLPLQPVSRTSSWHHLSGISLADPDFGRPGSIDLLLGVEVFADVVLHGRRYDPSGSPIAFETRFGWVLAGSVGNSVSVQHVVVHYSSTLTGDDILRKFWELEEEPMSVPSMSSEERAVLEHFKANYRRTSSGRFVVPLSKKANPKPLGESRSSAVRRFLSLERSLGQKGLFEESDSVIREYFEMEHAEKVPLQDLANPPDSVFYLPIHMVRKESSTTTKVRAVFDASAKSSSGVSLNDQLLVGPTVHSSLIDVLVFVAIE